MRYSTSTNSHCGTVVNNCPQCKTDRYSITLAKRSIKWCRKKGKSIQVCCVYFSGPLINIGQDGAIMAKWDQVKEKREEALPSD